MDFAYRSKLQTFVKKCCMQTKSGYACICSGLLDCSICLIGNLCKIPDLNGCPSKTYTEGVFGCVLSTSICVVTNESKQALKWQVEPIQVRCLHGTYL
jgi:hypothetical protein